METASTGESVFQTERFQIPKSRHSSKPCLDSLVLDDSISLIAPSFCSRQEIALLAPGPEEIQTFKVTLVNLAENSILQWEKILIKTIK